MSTKENPGRYDCFAKLAPDEPYFVLRAKDPNAPALVELWAALREAQHGPYDKLEEARQCAAAMRAWKAAHLAAAPTIAPEQILEIDENGVVRQVPMLHESARPCGCDPGAKWVCEVHSAARGTR